MNFLSIVTIPATIEKSSEYIRTWQNNNSFHACQKRTAQDIFLEPEGVFVIDNTILDPNQYPTIFRYQILRP
jgi:hypothetical protein